MLTIVVLAAGSSRRFGSPKQLHVFEGETLLHRAARVASEVAETLVVLPPNAPLIREAIHGLAVRFVENANAAEGVASSIRAGVRVSTGDMLLMTCDQPYITADHVRALAAAGPLAASGYAETFGIPAFFAASYRPQLLSLRSDVGAKTLLLRHRDALNIVPFEPAAIDFDEPLSNEGTQPR